MASCRHDRQLLAVLRRYVDNAVAIRMPRVLTEQEWATLETCLYTATSIQHTEQQGPSWLPAISQVRKVLDAISASKHSSEACNNVYERGPRPASADDSVQRSAPVNQEVLPEFETEETARTPTYMNQPQPADKHATAASQLHSLSQIVHSHQDSETQTKSSEMPELDARQQRPVPTRPSHKRSSSTPLRVRFADITQDILRDDATSPTLSTSTTDAPAEPESSPSSAGSKPVSTSEPATDASQKPQLSADPPASKRNVSDAPPAVSQSYCLSPSSASGVLLKIYQHWHHATAGILRQAAPLTLGSSSSTRSIAIMGDKSLFVTTANNTSVRTCSGPDPMPSTLSVH